jgi:hypothetical protein
MAIQRIYVRPNLVMLVFVRPNSSYVRPKLKVIGQMSCQVKYLFAALLVLRVDEISNQNKSSTYHVIVINIIKSTYEKYIVDNIAQYS